MTYIAYSDKLIFILNDNNTLFGVSSNKIKSIPLAKVITISEMDKIWKYKNRLTK